MKTKIRWVSCKAPTDCGQFVTPPACGGRIVLRSYAIGGDGDILYRRTWDQSNGKRTYEKRFVVDDELIEPWNVEPE